MAANAETMERETAEAVTEAPAEGATGQSTDLAVYSDLQAQLHRLREFDESREFDYRSSGGNKEARSHVWKLRRTKTAIDEVRKTATKPLRDRVEAINSEGKYLIGEIDELIQPHQREIEQVEAEEKARAEALQNAVSTIRDMASAEPEAGSERLRAMVAEAEALDVSTESWGDYAAPAENARDKAVTLLSMRVEQAEQREADAAERAREQAERERERQEREREKAELDELRREKAEREARERAEAEEAAAAQAVADKAEAVTGDGSGEALPEVDDDQGERVAAGVDEHRERREMERAEAVEALQTIDGIGPAKAFAILDAIIAGKVPHVRFDGEGL